MLHRAQPSGSTRVFLRSSQRIVRLVDPEVGQRGFEVDLPGQRQAAQDQVVDALAHGADIDRLVHIAPGHEFLAILHHQKRCGLELPRPRR
jgi:hypothetical protein